MGEANKRAEVEVEEYLQGELNSEVRHEYIGGHVYAMSGESEEHNLISGNLYAALRQHLRGNPCRVFMADMKVRLTIASDDVFYYPDLLVTRDSADGEKYYKTKPAVLVEVLSPSTECLYRREKFLSYQRFDSLQEYVLVDQSKIEITLFERKSGWNPLTLKLEDVLHLDSLDFSLPVQAIYEDVF